MTGKAGRRGMEGVDRAERSQSGKVWLVGAGCGGPELITVKGLSLVESCDVLLYDSLSAKEFLERARPDCERIDVGKRYGGQAVSQEEINRLLVQKAGEGKRVVRLKGGDPYVFGRGGEEMLALQEAGIACEEVPGISSAIAAPAAAGIPVTHRGLSRSVTVLTASSLTEGEERMTEADYGALARLSGTLVILMDSGHSHGHAPSEGADGPADRRGYASFPSCGCGDGGRDGAAEMGARSAKAPGRGSGAGWSESAGGHCDRRDRRPASCADGYFRDK